MDSPIRRAACIIWDGFGIGAEDTRVNATKAARLPFINALLQQYPHAQLRTDGEHVGLPTGQMGNSEVGHMNIGAGRVIYQQLVRINKAINQGALQQNDAWNKLIEQVKASSHPLHLMGLLSDGGVHSHIDHLEALVRQARDAGVEKINIHAFTDGRDTDPNGGLIYLKQLQDNVLDDQVKLSTIVGRYYSMDRDKRWERTRIAYDALINGKGKRVENWEDAVQKAYDRNETDEFLMPILPLYDGEPAQSIRAGSCVLFFNFRTDRGRQLTEAMVVNDHLNQEMKALKLNFYTLTRYSKDFREVVPLFEDIKVENTLGEVVSRNGLKQLRVAETEKYPHVTFFLNNGREEPLPGEERIMAPSPKVSTYDLQPDMSAREVTDKTIAQLKADCPELLVLNYANPDMVGHTGVFSAVIKALETVDSCSQDLVNQLLELDFEILIIADHGNSEYMINDDGSPNTAHTTNPVPVIYIGQRFSTLNSGILADIAPTLLKMLNLPQPEDMTGEALLT